MKYKTTQRGVKDMFISACGESSSVNEPADFLPERLKRYFKSAGIKEYNEIRLRCGQPMVVSIKGFKYHIDFKGRVVKTADKAIYIKQRDIEEAMDIITNCSVYTYIDELQNGFITVKGGHRIGICGTLSQNGTTIREISGLNYRYAKEIPGCANSVVSKIYNSGDVLSTLIISKPGCGKTTFLRDLVRQVSDLGCNVSVVDERQEIAAVYNNIPNFDVGINTDVMSMAPKSVGMRMMLRSMSPSVIAVDEFDFNSDGEFISEIINSGVSLFATMHGNYYNKNEFSRYINGFQCIIVLSDKNGPGTLERCIYV